MARRLKAGAGVRRGSLNLTGRESVLVLAPHCDDETLGAGALLHEAVELGCQVKVIFITNGDGFRYAANRQFKKLLIPPDRQVEFAYLRQKESLRALSALGVQPAEVAFLGYPDRGLQALWNESWSQEHLYRSPYTGVNHSPYRNSYTLQAPYCGTSLVNDLHKIVLATKPTHIVIPHPRDAHGDHTATFCFIMHALEELHANGYTRIPQVFTYLVHRGTWPYPRGLHPRLEMQPPLSFATLSERWLAFRPSSSTIAAKHRAVLQYRSQLNLLGRFLFSFVRRTELFGTYSPFKVRSVPTGAVFVDGSAAEWPEGVGYLPDPVRDTLTRNVERGADVRSIAVCADAGYLFLRLAMYGKVVDEVRYTVRLSSCSETRKRLNIRLVVPNRVLVWQGQQWVPSAEIICRSSGNIIELAIPRYLLGSAGKAILGVETRYRQIMVDRTAWEILALPTNADATVATVFCTAAESDLPGIAAVFIQAFHDEIYQVLGVEPVEAMFLHLFELLYEAEPQALFVARQGGKVVGYVFAPAHLKKVWHTALVEGHLWRWFTNWLRKRYPIRFLAARTLLLDKYIFLRSAMRDKSRIENRILSVGVLPESRHMGIATRLVQQALVRFTRLGVPLVRLEVRPNNEAALHIYTKLGFTVHGSMCDTRGEWWVMVKELEKESTPTTSAGSTQAIN